LKWLSLFSGIGGFDLALEKAGHTVVGACEIDEYARQVFQKRFPYVPLHKDATKLKAEELPDFDAICAGFPCQTFSIAGKRLGFEESRGTLFFEIARIAKQKRPRYLLLENVKGLLSHDSGRTFAEILATLDELGYDAEWQVLNSKYYVPQNRERIFIIGYLRNQPRPQIFPFGQEHKLSDESGRGKQESGTGIRSEVSTIDSRYGALRNSGETYIVADRSRSYAGTGRNLESPKNISNSLTSVQKDNLVVEPELDVIKDSDQDTYRLYGTEGISRSLRASPGGFGKMTGLYDVTPIMAPDIKKKSQNGRTIKEAGEPSFALTAQDKHGIIQIPKKKIRIGTPQVAIIQPYLREWLAKSEITITEIERIFGTRAPHHWFEKIKFASLPEIDDWPTLKEILKFDDKYDSLMTDFRWMTEFEIMLEHKARHKDKGNGFGVEIKSPNDNASALTTWTEKSQVLNLGAKIRRLTPTECERLQGFPDGWTSGISDTQRYKCLGNAVTVPVVYDIVKKLL
jgi:DNA (cytosine-5)-methyltransferase 1